MRGIVTLASALALPTINGAAFPNRNLILFLAFTVILVTLVLQGLSLPVLIRGLKIVDDGSAEREEHKARLKAAIAGRARLQELIQGEQLSPQLVEKLGRYYDTRVRRYAGRYHGNLDNEAEEYFVSYEQTEQDLLRAELEAIIKLRDQEIINDEILRKVQRDLDLQLLRLQNNSLAQPAPAVEDSASLLAALDEESVLPVESQGQTEVSSS
jgi:CPA1 family monovalent cation:H+ antiporter